tara:strand:+ start:275 stop:469 length:195 start_codon:yes stop_codon:yes gene_type:complete
MEPNWSRLWDNPQRKMCTKQEITDKLSSLEESGENYYFEYVSSAPWSDNADESYIKIKKRVAAE